MHLGPCNNVFREPWYDKGVVGIKRLSSGDHIQLAIWAAGCVLSAVKHHERSCTCCSRVAHCAGGVVKGRHRGRTAEEFHRRLEADGGAISRLQGVLPRTLLRVHVPSGALQRQDIAAKQEIC